MIIKYDPEIIQFEDQTDTVEGEEKIDNSTFNIVVLATDEEYTYSTIYGNFDNFHELNKDNGIDGVKGYEIIHKIPEVGVKYFFDTKYGIPNNVNEAIKYKTRSRIKDEVGDIEDLIADLSKRLTYVERLGVTLANELMMPEDSIVPNTKDIYHTMIQGYIAMHESTGGVSNIADLENPMALFQKLFERSVALTHIVNDDYLTKKI